MSTLFVNLVTGASLGALSAGRVSILSTCVAYFTNAVTIAVRYSAVRRQFGPTQGVELAVIEYQLQQWRLFPYLAALYAFKNFADFFTAILGDFTIKKMMGDPFPNMVRFFYFVKFLK